MGGGAGGNRTLDLLNAIQALSQLSYGPTRGAKLTQVADKSKEIARFEAGAPGPSEARARASGSARCSVGWYDRAPCRSGGIGIRRRLKIARLRSCGFKSRLRHHFQPWPRRSASILRCSQPGRLHSGASRPRIRQRGPIDGRIARSRRAARSDRTHGVPGRTAGHSDESDAPNDDKTK